MHSQSPRTAGLEIEGGVFRSGVVGMLGVFCAFGFPGGFEKKYCPGSCGIRQNVYLCIPVRKERGKKGYGDGAGPPGFGGSPARRGNKFIEVM